MTTQISSDNIQPSTLASISGGPKITNIQITNSSYVVIDDTAVAITGGYIKITGSGFVSGCTVIINGTAATSVTFVSSTVLNAQVGAQNAGTYIVYVTNTDGSTAIRVNGITYSSTPTWVTGSTLPTGTVGSAISIQLSATGDAPLVYSLQAGSSLPTGLTLTSGGLLSGTVTGLTTDVIYNFTIEAIDAQYQESPRAFSITITAGDAYWAYVSTLLGASTPLTLPFNRDASTNNFAVTIAGDTRPYNFNPYTPGYYSVLFNGTTDYLTVGSTNQNLSGDFTIEAWVYQTVQNTFEMICGDGPNYWAIGATNNFELALGTGTVTYPAFTSGSAFPLNQWVHVAISRSGTSLRGFINGTQIGTTATNSSVYFNNSSLKIGQQGQANYNYYHGSISNFRIVKGQALYTSNFTPSTDPLTTTSQGATASNVNVLTCQSNRYIDNSNNAFTITPFAGPQIKSFTPYTPNSSYSTYGSTYFDGTGDYLQIADNTALQIVTGTFTIEAWFYLTATPNGTYGAPIISKTNGSNGWELRAYATGAQWVYPGVAGYSFGPSTISLYTWYHIAVVRSGTTVTGYVNGTQYSVTTNSVTETLSPVTIGYDGFAATTGYITDVRIVKGTAVYTTSTFTLPTSPLTAITNTVLLTCQGDQPVANNTFLDNSTSNFAIARAGNTTLGTFSPYGENWSTYFNGTTDSVIINANSLFAFSGDFTIECWIQTSTSSLDGSGYGRRVWTMQPSGQALVSGLELYFYNAGATTNISVQSSTNIINGTIAAANGSWNHIALCRSGTSLRLFVNGTQSGSTYTTSQNYNVGVTYGIILGATGGGTNGWYQGYISNFRAVNGTALYTNTFTPSTIPLQPIANTVSLLCQSPAFIDRSGVSPTVSKNGTPSIQKFGPFPGTTLPTPYYGAYFDGSGDYLTLPASTAALQPGSGNFTIEFWYYPTLTITGYINIFSYGASGDTLRLFEYTTNALLLWIGPTPVITSPNNTVVLNTWAHVAVVRNGTTLTLYVNGVSVGSTTSSINLVGDLNICYESGQTSFQGYLSNFRLVKGTAVYTTTFTPSTTPLTAIANTSLLTCQSNTFVDNSTNAFTITVSGNSQPTRFNPFTVTYSSKQSYTPAVYGGSMYFDGTGDYLTSSNIKFGTNNFTIEGWFYPTTIANLTNFWGMDNGAGSVPKMLLYISSAGNLTIDMGSAGTTQFPVSAAASTYLKVNAWNHIAVVRTGLSASQFILYINGINVSVGQLGTDISTITATFNLGYIGEAYGQLFSGYVSDFRINNGTALYTSNFAPLNAPLAAVKNTTLLLSGTGAGMYDGGENAIFETAGDAKLSTTTVKFSGTTSMYFDGTGDYLVTFNTTIGTFFTGDLTMEAWVYRLDTGVQRGIIDTRGSSNVGILFYFTTDNKLNLFDSITTYLTSTNTVPSGSWYHVAVTRSSGTTRLFINGNTEATLANDTRSYQVGTGGIMVGRQFGSTTSDFYGYMSDVRITKGYARYTTNFTTPTSPFQNK